MMRRIFLLCGCLALAAAWLGPLPELARAMGTSINKEMNTLERGMTFLASIGSTAPGTYTLVPRR